MEFIEIVERLFSDQDFLFKIFLIVVTSLYGLFALILWVQIRSLNKIIDQIDFSPVFNALGFLHLLGALALIFLSVVFL